MANIEKVRNILHFNNIKLNNSTKTLKRDFYY